MVAGAVVEGLDVLAVRTPEQVLFEYPKAGIGSRFLAQCIDLAIMLGLLLVCGLIALVTGTGNPNAGWIVLVLSAFVVLVGYSWVQEAAWSGQTVGKYMLGLRVVDQLGGPLTFTQASIRNLARMVDILPGPYSVGLVTIFLGGEGKRLGDYAAGTVVVRERSGGVRLSKLMASASLSPPAALPPADEMALKLLDPDLRHFVLAYADRAFSLDYYRRYHLAWSLGDRLSRVMPELWTQQGPLAVLDRLAWAATLSR